MGLFSPGSSKSKTDFQKGVHNSRAAFRSGTANRVHGAVLSTNRDQKAAMLRALPAPPRVVILGSSRSKTLPPACVTALGGGPAFNFAVNGAATQDLVAIGRYLRARAPGGATTLLGLGLVLVLTSALSWAVRTRGR